MGGGGDGRRGEGRRGGEREKGLAGMEGVNEREGGEKGEREKRMEFCTYAKAKEADFAMTSKV